MNVDVLHFFSRYMWTEQLSCPSCLFLVDKKLPRAFSSLRIGFSAWIRIQQNYDFYLLSYHPIGKPIAYTVIPVIFVLKVAEFWVTWLKSAERRVQNCFCKPRAVDSEKLLVHQHQTSINRSSVEDKLTCSGLEHFPCEEKLKECPMCRKQGFKQDLRASFLSTTHKQALHNSAWWNHEAAINWNMSILD